jgi:hypothetical protein
MPDLNWSLRRQAGRLRNSLGRIAHAIDPTPHRAHRLFDGVITNRAALICIYRIRNAEFVEELVREASGVKMAIALWALDFPIASLARWTVGSGPGLRMRLLNRLWEAIPRSAVVQLVVCDDDVVFTRGSVVQLVGAATLCGFGIAQPAHAPGSACNYEITVRRGLTLARLTSFVESGPVFVVSKQWLPRVVPFPEEFGMGWGIEMLWLDLQQQGCRLGIVDSVCIRHIAPALREYDANAERRRVQSLLKARNFESVLQTQQCFDTWHVWERKPPWQ